MPLRKRKALPGQTKLEDVTEQDVTVTKSTAGDLAHPTKETKHDLRSAKAEDSEQHDGEDLFLKRRAKKTGMAEPAAKKQHKAGPKKEADKGASATSDAGIWVNRAPTITLWVAVVAQRQGYSREAGERAVAPRHACYTSGCLHPLDTSLQFASPCYQGRLYL